jgi:hypothetical protein
MLEALLLGLALVVDARGVAEGSRALAHRLERAAAGLVVMSETDAPLEGVVAGRVPPAGLTVRFVRERFGYARDTPVRVREVEAFLSTHSTPRSWHSREEARRARRFRALGLLLQRTLRHVRVFEAGTIDKDVLVLGVTGSGICVGLRTRVVET